jgi:hypothetical protein
MAGQSSPWQVGLEPIETTVCSIVKKLGYTLRRATETGLPNLRSGEPVARMPSAGVTNFR